MLYSQSTEHTALVVLAWASVYVLYVEVDVGDVKVCKKVASHNCGRAELVVC